MVLVLEEDSDVDILCEWLDTHRPGSNKVLAHISSKRKQLMNCLVLVNRWPHPSAVFIKPTTTPVMPGNAHALYALTAEDCCEFIKRQGVVDWDKPMLLGGIDREYVDIIRKEAELQGGKIELEVDCQLLCYSNPLSEQRTLPEEFEFVSLKPADASTILNSWKHNAYESVDYVRFLIENYLTIGIRTKDSRQLVGWSLLQHYGSCGMTHTLPEFRGQGLASCLTQAFAEKLLASGYQHVFVYVENDNPLSLKMHINCGYEVWPKMLTWVLYQPKPNVK